MTKSPQSAWRGHLAMLLANIGWGIMSPVTKSVLNTGSITPIALSAIRIAGGASLFWLFTLLLPASMGTRQRVDRADIWKLVGASLLMIAANQGLYIIGIGFTSPIDSAVMSTLTPVFTLILAAIFIGMPITRLKAFGVVLGLTGALLMVLGGGVNRQATNPALGDMLCMGAQLCAAVYYVTFIPLIQKYSPFTLMKWMFTISAVTYVPCTWPWLSQVEFSSLSATVVGELAYIIVVATFLSYLLIPYAQQYLKPTVMAMYNYFQPVASAVVTALLGVGVFGTTKIAATTLIFVGVYCVSRATTPSTPK
jgi:drug/metabolite transporter (DMT)-like permease